MRPKEEVVVQRSHLALFPGEQAFQERQEDWEDREHWD